MPTSTTNNQFPPFPEDIIQGLAREFVELYAPIREVLPQALWLSFCTYLGAVVSPYVRLNARSSEPRYFSCIVGRSSKTRKSSANDATKELFSLAFPETPTGSSTREELHIVPGFGSSEGLLCELEGLPMVPTVVYLDEINVLAQKTSGDGTIGISAFNKLFEDHDYTHPLAGGKGPRVRDAYLSLIGASTKDDFTDTWKGKHANAGFFSRLLIVGVDDPVTRISIPKNPDAAALKTLAEKLKLLYADVKSHPRNISLAPEAQQAWDRFYGSFGDDDEWNRIDTYGMRLMALQTVLEDKQVVTEGIVKRVIDFLYYEVVVRKIVAPVIADNQMAEMEQRILKALEGVPSLTKRLLERKTNSSRKGTQLFQTACKNLKHDGKITITTDPKHKALFSLVECEEDASEDNVITGVINGDDDSVARCNTLVVSNLGRSSLSCHHQLVSPTRC